MAEQSSSAAASHTVIDAAAVRVIAAKDLPLRWAADLGQQLHGKLDNQARDYLEERVVSLGHGVMLAHQRTPLVRRPTIGAFKAADAQDQGQPWLWLVVLVPTGEAARHLGWMAHLAHGLHHVERRNTVYDASSDEQLLRALSALVTPAPQRATSGSHDPAAAGTTTAIRSGLVAAAGAAGDYRLVIAILKEIEFVDHLLALFIEHDVRGATVLEARGMAEHLAAHISLFAGFKSAFKAVGHSQVIMTLVPAARSDEVLALVREAAGGMTQPGSGIAFTLDVPRVIGLGKSVEA